MWVGFVTPNWIAPLPVLAFSFILLNPLDTYSRAFQDCFLTLKCAQQLSIHTNMSCFEM
ncbi:hypothetical protein RHMOL_Rhmol02G0167200 [Rhododendron molle]|uniref:Uncharacterized protein n=1 Tax=Rhododendron molle TaxID=49168 RepID=A0ACC0PSK9_RHOML|nr:hypothetical protein RHMOL_Rhmol02G0167200 [Rhododendron molle]